MLFREDREISKNLIHKAGIRIGICIGIRIRIYIGVCIDIRICIRIGICIGIWI